MFRLPPLLLEVLLVVPLLLVLVVEPRCQHAMHLVCFGFELCSLHVCSNLRILGSSKEGSGHSFLSLIGVERLRGGVSS